MSATATNGVEDSGSDDHEVDAHIRRQTFNLPDAGGSARRIVYTKTSCYFCNEWLDGDSFKDHLSQCGQTLVECPNQCTAYVARKLLDDHLQLCPKSPIHSTQSLHNSSTPTPTENSPTILAPLLDRLQLLEHDLHRVRIALHEETRQRHAIIVDVGALRRRHEVDDEWTQKVGQVLGSLKRCLGEESQSRCDDVQTLRSQIGELSASYASMAAWRSQMRDQLERLEAEMMPEVGAGGDTDEEVAYGGGGGASSSWRTYIDVLMTDQRTNAMRTYELQNEVHLLRQRADDAQRIAATTEALVAEKCARIDEFLAAQRAERRATQRASMHESTTGKLATLDFELKSLKHICTATEDKCDQLDTIVRTVRATATHTRQQLAERREQERVRRTLHAIENVQGHLVWRIGDFAAQMQAAREDDVRLHSPVFCDRQYGYTLRLEVRLNGMGTWRGRNVLACLSLVAGGEWDTLLAWPCKLRAEIRLREQPLDVREARDVCKTIVAKGCADADEQGQYIFITHKALRRGAFVRDDAIFFEVRVRRDVEERRSGAENGGGE